MVLYKSVEFIFTLCRVGFHDIVAILSNLNLNYVVLYTTVLSFSITDDKTLMATP